MSYSAKEIDYFLSQFPKVYKYDTNESFDRFTLFREERFNNGSDFYSVIDEMPLDQTYSRFEVVELETGPGEYKYELRLYYNIIEDDYKYFSKVKVDVFEQVEEDINKAEELIVEVGRTMLRLQREGLTIQKTIYSHMANLNVAVLQLKDIITDMNVAEVEAINE